MANIDVFFKFMVEQKASDLHMSVSAPPILRIHGDMIPMKFQTLTDEYLRGLLYEIMSEGHRARFEKTGDVDFGYEVPGVGRFRANVFKDRNGVGAVFRLIPSEVLSAGKLGLPEAILKLADNKNGLVLVTGPTGSGKSTTLAAMIDHINATRREHIITVEDPIEFVHKNKLSLINQREVESHTRSFTTALKAALREDPDVILVGELRDLTTIELAVTAAETGHLVFGTLHTNSAPKTLDRLIKVFPEGQQEQIRTMLSESLRGVVAQALLKRSDRPGRVAAFEIMVVTPAIANLIREAKTYQIKSVIQTGKQYGMRTMDQSLIELVMQRIVTPEAALPYAEDRKSFIAATGERKSSPRQAL